MLGDITAIANSETTPPPTIPPPSRWSMVQFHTINMMGGTFNVQGTGNFGGNMEWTFYNLSFGDGATSDTTTKAGANSINSSNLLTIQNNHRLEAGSSNWNLSWSEGTLTDISQI